MLKFDILQSPWLLFQEWFIYKDDNDYKMKLIQFEYEQK